LRRHPQIFLSDVKEPHYFAYDYPSLRHAATFADYEQMFAPAHASQLRGDVSPCYLSSTQAIPAVLKLRPDAKFMVLVRDPVEMIQSWHNQCVRAFLEDQKDLERAWRLQDERANGRSIPRDCAEPRLLNYKRICSLGDQVESLMHYVPESQRMILFFDDFVKTPRTVYQRIVAFLGIDDNGIEKFDRENVFARHRSETLAKLIGLADHSAFVRGTRGRWRAKLDSHGIHPLHWLAKYNLQSLPKPVLTDRLRLELQAAFASDVALLERLVGQPLSRLWWDRSEADPHGANPVSHLTGSDGAVMVDSL
jgi:hypothetical protein